MKEQFEKFDSLMNDVACNVEASLGTSAELAVRSSSSMEDLPGQAGAGLYDSFVGVKPEVNHIKKNILSVFLSLFT
jgi:phosphoenolpyruvate synthase/pyruvate phosphate dikinase